MDADPLLRDLTTREIERQERIVIAATKLFATFGRSGITFTGMAVAMKMATATLRKHFTCLDALLAYILQKHLQEIARALGQVPQDIPNRAAALRAAYLNHTRNFTAFTETHLIWVRLRHSLPPDELHHLEESYLTIGDIIAGPLAAETLSLLDNPNLDASRIEAFLQTQANPAPQPAEPPAQAPQPPRVQVAMVLPKRTSPGEEPHPDDVMIIRGYPPEPGLAAPPIEASPPVLRKTAQHAQHAA
jgi:AcrR family transcriptional regulator